jgi:hypothetical protein
MSTFSAKGFLECQSQFADPIKGRGELTATDRGFKWEAKRFLSGQTDGSTWENVHTFGRRGAGINIAYLLRIRREALNGSNVV